MRSFYETESSDTAEADSALIPAEELFSQDNSRCAHSSAQPHFQAKQGCHLLPSIGVLLHTSIRSCRYMLPVPSTDYEEKLRLYQ